MVDSNATCFGLTNGGATSSASGGTGSYTYLWSNSAITASIPGISAGSYKVIITDKNSCTDSSTVTITEPSQLITSTGIDSNVSCQGLANGGATVTATGGTGSYTYLWSNAIAIASINGVASGKYYVDVSDQNGCDTRDSATVTEPAALGVSVAIDSNVACNSDATGGVTVSVTGGTTPYAYTWNNSATSPSLAGIVAGSYKVLVTDSAVARTLRTM